MELQRPDGALRGAAPYQLRSSDVAASVEYREGMIAATAANRGQESQQVRNQGANWI